MNGEVWQNEKQFLPPHRRPVGYVFQRASLFDHLDVRGNINFGYRRTERAENKIGFKRAVELLGLENLLDRRVQNLSGGERQRVAMARALAVSPGVLLMDEPLAALDLERKSEILPYLESLVRELEIPLIYVSHAPDEVARLADDLVLLDDGRVKASGPLSEMLTREDLPLSHGSQAEALIRAKVVGYDSEYALNFFEFSGGQFTVPGNRLSADREVRLRVAARDVSLTTNVQRNTSILNIFESKVTAISPDGDAQVVVHLDVGGVSMLARVTRKSSEMLDLENGCTVYAQVKSVAVLS